ncbi:MAG: putative molybdopterin oxidoreductase, rane subunit [Dehalococcoidia bacterium]|nr:putative molybdopterin oxidoreductase, rane subunit [Dehalococcoidia bacterium]
METEKNITEKQLHKDLLAPVFGFSRRFWIAAGVLSLVLLAAGLGFTWMLIKGLGVTGLNRPVMWGFMITNFVFWVGISHAGVMISSILRLSRAEWRLPLTRAAEVLTLMALFTAALHPIIHSGRPWRTMYWAFPYDFSREIWPNIRSPLIWDVSAIFTYLISSTLFVYIALIPDLAIVRDRASGIFRSIYGALALGWRGTNRQWQLHGIVSVLLAALILPVFVSVHSIVSWDFAAVTSVEGWHSTIFAPYFVAGAIHSGVSAVVVVMALMRWFYGWEKYLRPEHFDAIGKLLIAIALGWFYFFSMEFIFGLYSLEGPEIALRNMQIFQPPWSIFSIVFLLTAFFIPVSLLLFRKVRRNILAMFFLGITVNIGMWFERFLIIVPGLARKTPFTFDWGTYRPSIAEIGIVAGSFGLVFLGLLIFAKIFPLVPISDQKEGQAFKGEIQIGRVKIKTTLQD